MSSTPSSLLQTTTTTTAPSASSATGAMDAREESTRGSTYGDDSASREKEATSTDSALGGEATRSVGYKGKALRSWMQLPPEVIRLIATYHLCVVDANSPVPFTWDVYTPQRYRKIPWTEHLAYLAARDTRDMETLMCVCPQWGLAVEQHEFWTNALQLLDPTRHAAHHGWVSLASSHNNSSGGGGSAPTAQRVSPYTHFRALLTYSCLPCRLNAPRTNAGLDLAKRVVPALRLGAAALCKEHAGARRLRYCGVCMIDGDIARRVREDALRMAQEDLARTNSALGQARYHMHSLGSAPPPTHPAFAVHANGKALLDAAQAAAEQAHTRVQRAMEAVGWPGHPVMDAGVAENEDETVFPGWLWRYALLSARVVGEEEAAALGRGLVVGKGVAIPAAADALGVTGASPGMFWPEDAAVKGAVNAFVELGEGTVNSVLAVAGERGWLRVQTRWVELMQQAMAAKRWGDGTAPPIPTGRVQGHDYSQRAPVPREQRDREREQMRRGAESYYDYDEDYEEEEDSDVSGGGYRRDGDDEVAAALEMTVREMALTDWARARVLDGAWVAPADVYYRAKVNGLEPHEHAVRSVHPVPWSISPPVVAPTRGYRIHIPRSPPLPSLSPTATITTPGTSTPIPLTHPACANASSPHIFPRRSGLTTHTYGSGGRRRVPPRPAAKQKKEKARRSCSTPACARHGCPLAEIVQLLREEEGVWFDGMDWGARRRNVRREEEDERAARAREEHARERDVERDGERERERRHRAERSDDSSAGTPSDPSPTVRPTIPVAPVLDPPRLLRPIPYIPESITHLPSYSLEAIKAVTDACVDSRCGARPCMPLYHCRCTVCERAMAAQNGGKAPSTTTTSAAARASTPAPTPQQKADKSVAPDGHWVHVSSEDDADEEGADSVIKLVEEEEEYDPDRDPRLERSRAGGKPTGRLEGLEGLTDAELLWLQQEEAEEDQWAAKEKERGEEREMVRRWEAAHPDYEDQYEEEEEDDTGGGGGGFMLNPAPAAWVAAGTGRKRSVDELDGGGADAHSRGGTPPKRARTKEPFPELAKRRSEELDFDERDADSASVGSAPKRARIEAVESPLDSSTPVSVPASGEESASSSPDMRAK
ncbi:hypothetical protein B0H14DRAFT_3021201 [Mycena olivaceomarginata]|nr:hypothetical protein B0H14DRAFT_3021201 [Mycena olivaceomarginata]